MRRTKRKLLVAALGATTITIGACEPITGNPKGPPPDARRIPTNPDAPPSDAAPDARPPDARPPDAAIDARGH